MPGVWVIPSWWPGTTTIVLASKSRHDGHELAPFRNLHNDLLFPLDRRGAGGTEWLSLLPKATQLLSNRAETKTHVGRSYPLTTPPFCCQDPLSRRKGLFLGGPLPAVALPHPVNLSVQRSELIQGKGGAAHLS